MDPSTTPYDAVERTALLVMSLSLSAVGAYFNRRWQIWQRLGSGHNYLLHVYAMGCIVTAWWFTCLSIASILFVDFLPIPICRFAIYLCIVLYWLTKVFIYMYLVERALIVRVGLQLRDYATIQRSNEPTFIANGILLLPYIGVLVVMTLYNVSDTSGEERCVIGLQKQASLSLAVYDTVFSTIITAQFVVPLMQKYQMVKRPVGEQGPRRGTLMKKLRNANTPSPSSIARKFRALAVRTLIGSSIALVASLANMISLVQFPAQPITHCLLACSMDVTIGCILVDYMSRESKKGKSRLRRSSFRFSLGDGLSSRPTNTVTSTAAGTQCTVIVQE